MSLDKYAMVGLAMLLCAQAQAAIGSWIEPNLGQTDPAVHAIARDGELIMLLQPQRARVLLPRFGKVKAEDDEPIIENKGHLLLELVMLGADPKADVIMGRQNGTFSRYFRGNDPGAWLQRVAHHDSVRFADVYPGIDLVYRLRGARIEYDFEVDAGADLSLIKLGLRGADDVSIDAAGDLVATTAVGEFRQLSPEIFRVVDGGLEQVAGHFEFDGDTVGFVVDADAHARVVIDPVIEFSGYLGGNGLDEGLDIAINLRGNLVVSGATTSTDLPGAPAVYVGGYADIYVAELDHVTGQLLWITFLGGAGVDWVYEIKLDSGGDIIGVGYTDSADFPTVNAFQDTFVGNEDPLSDFFNLDGVVFKLSDDGSQIVFSTYYGGADLAFVSIGKYGFERLQGVAIDSNDHIHVVGQTAAPDFPVTDTFRNRTCMETDPDAAGSLVSDTVLVELAPDGARLFATCIGGTDRDEGRGIAIGLNDSVFVGGFGRSADLPTSVDAFQPTLPDPGSLAFAPFLLKLDQTRLDIEWGTYFGGQFNEFVQQIAVLPDQSVAVTGTTESPDFPVTANALQPVLNAGLGVTPSGHTDAFVARLSADGTTLLYGTFFGGQAGDNSWATAVDDAGRIYFAGQTASTDLILRTPVQAGPGALYVDVVAIAPAGPVNGLAVVDDSNGADSASSRVVFVARDGVNRYYRELVAGVWSPTDASALAENSVDVITDTSFTDQIVFINRFAPNRYYRWDSDSNDSVNPVAFGSPTRDSRAGHFAQLGGVSVAYDVVVANYGEQNELFLDVAGTPAIVPLGRSDGNTIAVDVAQLDGLAESDVVFANQGQDVRLYPGLGDGLFGAPVILSVGSPNVSALATGDLDGDFTADVVIASNPGPLQIARFTGGVLQPVETIPGSTANTNALFIGDADGDEDNDLFVANDGPDQLYLNDGAGNFTLAAAADFPGGTGSTVALAEIEPCFSCRVFFAGDDGIGRHTPDLSDLYIAVIDSYSSTLEFSTYLSGRGDEGMVRGLTVGENGTILLTARSNGAGWPVVGAGQARTGSGEDTVIIEIDIDIDDDGVLDGSDNCLEVANPLQRDTDGDAYGNFCDPDLNNDGIVNFADLQLFKQRFFGTDPDADLNGDGSVNFAELQIVKAFIFGPPGPSGLLLP